MITKNYIIKIYILPKANYRFNMIPFLRKITLGTELRNNRLKFYREKPKDKASLKKSKLYASQYQIHNFDYRPIVIFLIDIKTHTWIGFTDETT